MPDLSIVIPTRNRPALLADVLVALAAQDGVAEPLEVIVVDDGSDPPLADAVDAQHLPLSVRMVRLSGVGIAAARNAGAAVATSSRLAFLDDDLVVDPGWAGQMLNGFHSGATVLGGRIDLLYESTPPSWWDEGIWGGYIGKFDQGDEPCELEVDCLPFGGNCAVARSAFEKAGGFDPTLGRGGGMWMCGEDTDLFRRILADGGSVAYVPEARVQHRIPPGSIRLRPLERRAHEQGLFDAWQAGGARLAPPPRRNQVAAWVFATGVAGGRRRAGARLWLAYCRGRRDRRDPGAGR